MFGKKLSEYIRFQRWVLILVALVFAVRFGASLAGLPNDQTKWISVNLVLLAGLIYAAVAVHTARFGAYKQLFGLLLVQNLLAHILIAAAILVGIITGADNIFTAPEYSGGGDGKTWLHVLAHTLAGIFTAFFAWLVGSLILFVTRKLQPRQAHTPLLKRASLRPSCLQH